ncbi:MAG: aminotransferase DegT [Alphaproteobacteria bacterium CG_4_10_14_0_2_um_filter_63_37]|nr:MAG: aminotransferase DegT [Alphaproteobacteria bacterium CG_4_10_14_0_2_um_filter_63_37]
MPMFEGREREYLNHCIDTGWVSSIGEYVLRFEREFAAYCGREHGVTLNSGTAALHLALKALDVGEGDEVVVPAMTFAACANAVMYLGATPVFVDSAPGYWGPDAATVAAAITARTKAVMAVHLYGQPCDIEGIVAVADKVGIPVVEDAAEAHGASVGERRVGSFGAISCFSFYGNKVITTGEGGVCLTSDPELRDRMAMLRDHGMDKARRYWHLEVGYNYRMTNLQAAVGCAQLERIEDILARRTALRRDYDRVMAGLFFSYPQHEPGRHGVNWLYTALLPKGCGAPERDALIAFLKTQGIDSRVAFPLLTGMPPYQAFATPTPHAADLSARGISLPTHLGMGTPEVERIGAAVGRWMRAQGLAA